MQIGITYDLKADSPVSPGAPDDLYEEFDSPATIEAIARVLRDLGHDVRKLGDGRGLLEQLLANPPDFVFNFAEGQGTGRSREARVPAVLEMLGIPHTGSDPLTLSVTLDKECAKRLAASYGIEVPKGVTVNPSTKDLKVDWLQGLRFPLIVKPAWEGSSKGIRNRCLVEDANRLHSVFRELSGAYQQPLLVEEYIQGDEITVGIIGNKQPQVLGIMRVLPVQPTERFVYGLEVKRDYLRQVRYECPAKLPPRQYQAVENVARTVFLALGCRDVARVDFRLRDGVPYFLEVNPLPGLNPESSDLVIMAKLVGWTYPQLIGAILQAALDRHGQPTKLSQFDPLSPLS
jgi:D-alanine-D-alanine ligase